MGKHLEYCKKVKETYESLYVLADMFDNPISARMQGIRFPEGHLYLVQGLKNELEDLYASMPVEDDPDRMFDRIKGRINTDLLQTVDHWCKYLASDDHGESAGFKCFHDYSQAVLVLMETYKQIGAQIFAACGFRCIHSKDGVCTGEFTKVKTECDGLERCECYDSGCPELDGWY